MTTTTNLQDLTSHESGAVYYPESHEIWIGNWSSFDGLPRVLAPLGTIGLGEELHAKRCAVPLAAKHAMQQHERDQGNKPQATGYLAWSIDRDEAIVVINVDWA